jgi:2-oxoglutarate dehydrogenase E2 component (dihydrolipoamide succinyltransferase)
MGVSVAEGTLMEWRKRPGDWVEVDETLAEVTTDKVDVEIPSPVNGRLAQIVVKPGETVPVGTVLAEIDTAASPGEPHPEESHEPSAETDRSEFYSPVVRRIAQEHRVDLSQVEGKGVGGRVRKSDVLAFIESHPADAERAAPVLHTESPYRPEEQAGDARREAMTPMRQAIARHMVESRRAAAHCTTIVEVDFSAVERRRSELRGAMERRGVRLTAMAFVARATVEALQQHPRLNASVDGDDLVHHDDVNLGIAVALEEGLIVPVIPRAQRLSLEGLAAEIAEIATRARDGRLAPDDVHGGTFTITNPGQFGSVLATPIINQPQVAILDMEAIVKRAVVTEGEDGDAIAIRPMGYLCMSWDHRALDGADAARFLATIKARLEGGGDAS